MPEYEITRSRRKTLCLKVEADGSVRVLAPMKASKKDIEAFVSKNQDFVLGAQARALARLEKYPPLSQEEKQRLAALAREYIPQRVQFYAKIMGDSPTGVKITMAERRFGSCSGKNSLCFSYRLMRYPKEAIDYVVVHELAHIRHKNHGRDFYKCIAAVMPDYKERQDKLKW